MYLEMITPPRPFLRTMFVLLLLIFGDYILYGQSAGHGNLTSIEAKARQIMENDEKFAELNRQHLGSYAKEQEKLQEMKRELNEMYARKAAELDELRRGYFCSDCKRPKSQIEREERTSFDEHIRQGAAGGRKKIPASPEMIAAKTREWDQKIEAKQKAIEQFEFAENEFTRKRADLDKQMQKLKDDSDRIRSEIVELSKGYKDKVVREGKSIAGPWIKELMQLVAEKHYIEDRIDILKVKSQDLTVQENEKAKELKEKIRKQNDEEIQKYREKIVANERSLQSLENLYPQRVAPIKSRLQELNQKLKEIDLKLRTPANQTDDELKRLLAEKETVESSIATVEKELENIHTAYLEDKDKLQNSIKTYQDKIWELTVNLAQRQQEGLEALKKAFAAKQKIMQDALAARSASLDSKGKQLVQKKEMYRKKFMEYAQVVEKERQRLVTACNQSGASCYGIDTHSTIILNWNNSADCVGAMENNKSIGTFYGCTEESAVYQSYYNMMASGFTDEDLSALQRRTSQTRYDMIYKKVID